MRLTPGEIGAIRDSANDAFGGDAIVRLFGSRMDDARRGGDIDLHVLVPTEPSSEARGRFRQLLERTVGERDYDIVIAIAGRATSPIDRRALSEGMIL